MSQQINLFNPIFLKQRKHFSAVAMMQALALVAAGCIALGAYSTYQIGQLDADATKTAAQLAAVQSQLAQVDALHGPRQKSQSLEDEIQKAESELRSLKQVSDVLRRGDLGNTRGYAEYMRAFSREIVDGVWLTGFGIQGAGGEIGLRGRALKPELVPNYIARLQRQPVLSGKSFSQLEMRSPDSQSHDKAGMPPKQAVSAAYVEFNLQSIGASLAPAGSLAARNK